MKLSIIIPTLNEAKSIAGLLLYLKNELQGIDSEIIVADAFSSDGTATLAEENGAIVVNCEQMSRAHQMNRAAEVAKGEVLYFVHADSQPPEGFFSDIQNVLNEGFDLGCYRFQFDSDRFLLKMNAFFTRFDFEVCRGGDQTLFIRNEEFKKLGGYNPQFKIMEEYDFLRRARKSLKFKIIQKDVVVSARKYEENSYFRVNLANFVVFNLFRFGASQKTLVKTYKSMLNHPKAEAFS